MTSEEIPALCAELLVAKAETSTLKGRPYSPMAETQAPPDGRAPSKDLGDFIGNVARLMDAIMAGYWNPSISHEDFRAQMATWATDMQADARKAEELHETLLMERDALRARVKKLEEALGPFAFLAQYYDPPEDDDDILVWGDGVPNYGDLRRARAVLEGGQ